MDYDFSQPNKDNVKIGDILLNPTDNYYNLLPITDIRELAVTAENDIITSNCPYARAIIITKNKEVLIGDKIIGLEREFLESEIDKVLMELK